MVKVKFIMSHGKPFVLVGADWNDIRAQFYAWEKQNPNAWLMAFEQIR